LAEPSQAPWVEEKADNHMYKLNHGLENGISQNKTGTQIEGQGKNNTGRMLSEEKKQESNCKTFKKRSC